MVSTAASASGAATGDARADVARREVERKVRKESCIVADDNMVVG